MEAILAEKPEDLRIRGQLLYFYWNSGDKVLGQQSTIEARRRHILWLIQHHPEHKTSRALWARISANPADTDPDPEGYRQARALWLEQVEKPGASVSVLSGAARFFRANDKALAEKMLLRAQALDPKGRWNAELGRLYYEILVGATSTTADGFVRSVDLASAHGSYASEVRGRLAAATDVTLLVTVAESLGKWGRTLYENHSLDFDPVPLATSYLDHAVRLDPSSVFTHQVSLEVRFKNRGGQNAVIPNAASLEAQYQAIAAIPEAQRYLQLSLLAEAACTFAEAAETKSHDQPAAKAGWATAQKCAEESLRLSAKFPHDSDFGTAVYNANTVLGLLAMRAGHRPEAVQFMLAAAKAPSTEELQYSTTDFSLKLPQWLYKDGERAAVVDFLERFAQVNVSEKGYLVECAKAIRAGKNPLWVIQR